MSKRQMAKADIGNQVITSSWVVRQKKFKLIALFNECPFWDWFSTKPYP